MNLDECLARACEQVPGLQQGALALLPEGLLIGSVGPGRSFEREPLVRSAARCLAGLPERPSGGTSHTQFVEHVFVSRTELVTIARSKQHPRLALALACSTETNLAFIVTASRAALRRLEETIDLRGFEL